jgi:hypothetical protein
MLQKQSIEAAPKLALNRIEAGTVRLQVLGYSPAFPQNHFPNVFGNGWEPLTMPKEQGKLCS